MASTKHEQELSANASICISIAKTSGTVFMLTLIIGSKNMKVITYQA